MTSRASSIALAWAAVATVATAVAPRWGPWADEVQRDRGREAFSAGDISAAVRHFERAWALAGDPETGRDLGTALLASGEPGAAAGAFERALGAAERPELRGALLHGLALARLQEAGQAPEAERRKRATASVAAGRAAVRLAPDAAGTRRNLALAERLLAALPPLPESSTGSGDRGGRSLTGGDPDVPSDLASGRWTTAMAEAILDGVANSDVEAIREMIRRTLAGDGRNPRGVAPGGRPW